MIAINEDVCGFLDVNYNWLKCLCAYNIIGGTSVDENGKLLFEPNKIASREEGVVVFARLIHLILNEDVDNPNNKSIINNVSDWAKANYGYMEKAGLLTEEFYANPKGALTRWELNDLFYTTRDYIKRLEDGVRGDIDYMTKDEVAYNINCACLSYRSSTPGISYSWGTNADTEYDNINYGIYGIDEYKATIKSPLIGWHHPATREDMISSLGRFAMIQMNIWSLPLESKKTVISLNAEDKDELREETKNYCAYFLEKNVVQLDENNNLNPKKYITKKEFSDTYVRVVTLIEACHEISDPYGDDFDESVWEIVPPLEKNIPTADYYMNDGDVLDILCTHGIID